MSQREGRIKGQKGGRAAPKWKNRSLARYANATEAFAKRPRRWILNLVFAVAFVALVIYMCSDIRILNAFDRPINWPEVASDITHFLSPDWDYFWGRGYYTFKEGVLSQCLVTFCLTVIGTSLAFAVAMPFGIFASHRLFGKKAYVSEIALIAIRTFPELLLALFLIVLSGTTIVTAILALSLHSVGMIGKLYADQIDESDLDSLEALDACGANGFQRIRLAVMPQVWPNFLSVGLYRFDINIRTATTLGLIIQSSAGIGFGILLDLNSNSYSKLGADTLGIVAMIIIVDLLSSWLRKKLV